MNDDDAIRRFAHDARGSLGTIRLSIGAVLDDAAGQDEFIREMLTTADVEARRLAACLAALPVLVGLAEAGADRTVDAAALLRTAAARARAAGGAFTLDVPEALPLHTTLDDDRLEAALSALLVLIGAVDAATVSVTSTAEALQITGGERWPAAEHFLDQISSVVGLRVEWR